MRAAVNGVDGVGEGKNIFGVAIVVLQCDFDVDLLALAFHVNGRIVERLFAAIQVLHEFSDAAGETEFSFFVGAFVFQRYFQAFIQEGQLAETLRKRVETVNGCSENFGVRVKGDFRSSFPSFTGGFQLGCGHAFFVGLLPDFAVAPDFQIEPIRERVDNRDAHAVQSARNFVSVAIKFSARVKHGHDYFRGGFLFGGVHVHGDATAVVDYGDAVIVVDRHVDFIAEAGHGFVHGIVHNFPDEMM